MKINVLFVKNIEIYIYKHKKYYTVYQNTINYNYITSYINIIQLNIILL